MNDTVEIPHPLRLAVGSHQLGSGRGCAMNLISYENGDSTISDMPACTDWLLAHIVQRVNDTYCHHAVDGMLCPACSIVVLDLAHRTVGTGGMVLAPDARRRVWVAIAADQARQVLHLAGDRVTAERYIVLAETYAVTGEKPDADAYAADADAYAAAAAYAATAAASADAAAAYAAYAADAAAYAAYAAYAATAADADAADAADAAAAYAADADAADAADAAAADAAAAYAATAAAANGACAARLKLTHRAIDLFQQLTGHTTATIQHATVHAAYTQMVTVA